MTVEVDGRKFRIYWQYEQVERLCITGDTIVDMTTCVVAELIKEKSDIDGFPVWLNRGVGVVVRYYKDKFDKNVARKITLERALNDRYEFGKNERTEIWNAYYKMRNNKW